MSHVPSSFVRDRKLPLKLFRGDAFLRGADQIDGNEPAGQAHVRIVKDSPNGDAVLIRAGHTLVQVAVLSSLASSLKLRDAISAATRAARAVWPADALKVSDALFFAREALHNLEDRRLSFVGFVCSWFGLSLSHSSEHKLSRVLCQGDNPQVCNRQSAAHGGAGGFYFFEKCINSILSSVSSHQNNDLPRDIRIS